MNKNIVIWIWFRRFLLLCFVLFLINYYSSSKYDGDLINKSVMTSEKIKEFESDIKKGKNIDKSSYMVNDYVDTSTIFSRAIYKTTNVLNEFITDKVFNIFKFVGRLFV